MPDIISFWSKAWSPKVKQSAPESSISFACGIERPNPEVAFSALTITKSNDIEFLKFVKFLFIASRPALPMTSPKNNIFIRLIYAFILKKTIIYLLMYNISLSVITISRD